jgi:hypothetical protein
MVSRLMINLHDPMLRAHMSTSRGDTDGTYTSSREGYISTFPDGIVFASATQAEMSKSCHILRGVASCQYGIRHRTGCSGSAPRQLARVNTSRRLFFVTLHIYKGIITTRRYTCTALVSWRHHLAPDSPDSVPRLRSPHESDVP